jgi:hypothetical protein
MNRIVKNYVNRSAKRIRVYYRNFCRTQNSVFNPNHDLTETQKLAISIVQKAIASKNSVLFASPISSTRYIHSGDIFIKITYKLITVINGTYTYHVDISEKSTMHLIDKFNFKLESIQRSYEQVILSKTTKSLNSILEDLTKNNK